MKVVLGLGSNISSQAGNRMGYLRRAIQILKSPLDSPWIDVIAASPLYESDALLPEGAPPSWNHPFLNLCLLCETKLKPLELLQSIKKVETRIGRKHRDRWAPREIDLDLLAIEGEPSEKIFDTETLKIPHPGLLERPFAIFPLADLLPHWELPQPGPFQGSTAAEFVAQWKVNCSGQIPYRTRRSPLFLTELVGILNLTPDSFSDGGFYQDPKNALEQAIRLLNHGATILDIGAESTRPGAIPLQPEDEWARLEPVLAELKALSPSYPEKFTISIDTRHPETALRCIQAGAHWINDVTGLQNSLMRKIAAESTAKSNVDWVVMHSLTVPVKKEIVLSGSEDPISALLHWGKTRISELQQAGIPAERIIFDPGIGFGKTQDQNWNILRQLDRFHELGVRVLVGHSRKSFISTLTDRPYSDRDIETLSLSLPLASKGADYLRVHNIDIHHRGLQAWTQIDGSIRYRNSFHDLPKNML